MSLVTVKISVLLLLHHILYMIKKTKIELFEDAVFFEITWSLVSVFYEPDDELETM